MLALPEVLTLASATACLRTLSTGLAQEPAEVVVDASRLGQFDSAALAVLLELRRRALKLGKTFAVQAQPRHLSDLARLYGITELLPAVAPTAPVK
mgnify:CR=1 FL=1